jgi:hypothetical protein
LAEVLTPAGTAGGNPQKNLEIATGQRTLFNGSSNLHKGSLYNEDGHLVVEDKVIGSATSGQLTPSTSDLWFLRDNTTPTPLVVARLTSAGTLYLKGTWAEKQSSLSPPSGSRRCSALRRPRAWPKAVCR